MTLNTRSPGRRENKSLSVANRKALEAERVELRQKAKDLKADFYHRTAKKWGLKP